MGRFKDVVRQDYQLVDPSSSIPPNPFGIIKEMYEMIWVLADRLAAEINQRGGDVSAIDMIKMAESQSDLGGGIARYNIRMHFYSGQPHWNKPVEEAPDES